MREIGVIRPPQPKQYQQQGYQQYATKPVYAPQQAPQPAYAPQQAPAAPQRVAQAPAPQQPVYAPQQAQIQPSYDLYDEDIPF